MVKTSKSSKKKIQEDPQARCLNSATRNLKKIGALPLPPKKAPPVGSAGAAGFGAGWESYTEEQGASLGISVAWQPVLVRKQPLKVVGQCRT